MSFLEAEWALQHETSMAAKQSTAAEKTKKGKKKTKKKARRYDGDFDL